MKKLVALLLTFSLALGAAGCSDTPQPQDSSGASQTGGAAAGEESSQTPAAPSSVLIAYLPQTDGSQVEEAAALLGETLHADVAAIDAGGDLHLSSREFVLLGFAAQDSALPDAVRDFLSANDFGARTIYPFVAGEGNDADAIFAAISQLQPGALLGDSALLFTAGTQEQQITGWAGGLGLLEEDFVPEGGDGNTVATATVTPHAQQVLYLWEEGTAPATTSYTVNNGGYSDDPDFRPYLTSFPVPEGTAVKGAVLICPGGAFQFRSDQPEGVDAAQALSALGYQSFVVDYRLRPYTQQEGALDLARAVRFVRAHAGEYGIGEEDIAVMGFSAGGILSGEMLLHFDGLVSPASLDSRYQPDALDRIRADAAACGMIYSFYGRLSVGTTDVQLLRSGDLPPTFYCYGTRDPFYDQFLANASAAEEAGAQVQRLQLDDMPHGFGAQGGWIPTYDGWLSQIFGEN